MDINFRIGGSHIKLEGQPNLKGWARFWDSVFFIGFLLLFIFWHSLPMAVEDSGGVIWLIPWTAITAVFWMKLLRKRAP